MKRAPAVSVVVMGYRNRRTIREAVASVLEQKLDGELELIVVTSGGDDSAALVRESFPDVHVIESAERLLPGGARNAGIAAAHGQIVAFLAADCEAAPGWLANRLAAHRAGNRAVAAAVAPAPPLTRSAWAAHFLLFPARLPGGTGQQVNYPDDRAHGISYERSLLEELGPFPEASRIGEDTDMARRLRDAGVPVWFEPSSAILHRGPRRVTQLVRDQFRRGYRSGRFPEELLPHAGLLRLAVRTARGVVGRLCWIAPVVRRCAPDHGVSAIGIYPLVAVGTVAYQLGWLRGRIAVRSRPAVTHPAAVQAEVLRPGGTPERLKVVRATGGAVVHRVHELPGISYGYNDAVVAITFDDGPHPDHTPKVLSTLERHGVRATFFMVGERAAHYPDLVREVAARGHTIGGHTWTHADLRELNERAFEDEIDRTNELLSSLSGRPVLGVRPPAGRYDARVVRRLGERGLATILWSADTRDWSRPGVRRIARAATHRMKPGHVILLHDGGRDRVQTIEALPRILERIQRTGYRAVTLAEADESLDL